MIISNIKDASRYMAISPAMKKAIEYIQSGSWKKLPADKKRYPIYEGEVEAVRMVYETSSEGKWESHQTWTDIQMLVSGEEKMLFAPASSLKKEGGYISEKDFQGYNTESKAAQSITAAPEQLIFFFPEDAHQPNLSLTQKEQVDKVVVKVIAE